MLYWILDLAPNFNWLLIWTALDFSCCHPYHPFIVYFHLPSSSLSVNSSPELMLSVVLPDLEIKHILSYLILSFHLIRPVDHNLTIPFCRHQNAVSCLCWETSISDPPVLVCTGQCDFSHYGDVITTAMANQISSVSIVYSTVCLGTDQRKHHSSASLAYVRGIHRCKMFVFDDVIIIFHRKRRFFSLQP